MKLSKGEGQSPDTIDISPEAKKKQLLHEITSSLVGQAKNQAESVETEDVEKQLFEKIGKKFNERVDIIPQRNKNSGFKFKILSKDSGEKIEELSFEDLKGIVEGLYNDQSNGESI
ncbi:MAG: hypothetical protein GXO58_08600 [Thermodesulfobacteria bacterium]|nr:hypothetical protein [Thermodesulfobacteriota bacterium]